MKCIGVLGGLIVLVCAASTGHAAGKTSAPWIASYPKAQDFYPAEAQGKGEQGFVVVDVCHDADGAIATTKVYISSGFESLDAAALRASQQVRIMPGKKKGDSQEGCLKVLLSFFPRPVVLPETPRIKHASFASKPDIYKYIPWRALDDGEEGSLSVMFCHDTEGKVREVQIDESSGFDRIDKAGVRYALDVRINPGTVDGIPLAQCLRIPVRFSKTNPPTPPR